MQSLCLDDYEREKTMNRDFVFTANSDIIQSSIAFQSSKNSLNRCPSIIESLPIDLNDWYCSILSLGKPPQFTTTISCISNNIFRTEFAIGKSSLAQNTTGNSHITGRASCNIGSYGKLILGICQKVKLIAVVEFLLARCIKLSSPGSIWVRRRSLGTVRPSLQVSAVNSNTLYSETRLSSVIE